MKGPDDPKILSRIDGLAGLFEAEHRHPVNRWIHLWIGMPLVGMGLALLILFRWQGVVLVLVGYAAMFAGHYAFEKSPPTVVKTPLGPLAAGIFVIRQLFILPIRRWRSRQGLSL